MQSIATIVFCIFVSFLFYNLGSTFFRVLVMSAGSLWHKTFFQSSSLSHPKRNTVVVYI